MRACVPWIYGDLLAAPWGFQRNNPAAVLREMASVVGIGFAYARITGIINKFLPKLVHTRE